MFIKYLFIEESVDVKTDNPVQEEEEEQTTVKDNDEEKQQSAGEDSENDNEEEEEEESKGPLTAVESTCMLSDMVSKLTLIHETASRPLPFVDESIAQKFLNCSKTTKDSAINSETDNIKTLEDCFQRYFKPETLSGENLFDCYYCRSLDQTQSKNFKLNYFLFKYQFRKNINRSHTSNSILSTSTHITSLS